MAVASNLASPGLRLVGGLVDLIILGVVSGILGAIVKNNSAVSSAIGLVLTLLYFGYLLSSRGQSVGMMIFGFHVRDIQTGQYPTMGKAVLRAFVWYLEVGFTVCIVGLIGWLWMFWDPQKQGWHDKAAGTIVTTS